MSGKGGYTLLDISKETLNISPDGLFVEIIDQSQLPNKLSILKLSTPQEVYDAIYHLKVRGAPAIGVCAALALSVFAKNKLTSSKTYTREQFVDELSSEAHFLQSSRPTAVNLSWAIEKMLDCLQKCSQLSLNVYEIEEKLSECAHDIYQDDIDRCKAIGEAGLPLVRTHTNILTHCNAGRLATVQYGTALAPIYLAHEQNLDVHVYVDETRPLLQGARLSAFELTEAGINTTVLCDSMSSILMKQNKIDMVIVGADRIAANGDSANKVGSSNLAIVANYYKIPFYVAAPVSTIDLSCKHAEDIPIEMRSESEVREMWYTYPMITRKAQIFNPAFDIIDKSLITGFITDQGLITDDLEKQLNQIVQTSDR